MQTREGSLSLSPVVAQLPGRYIVEYCSSCFTAASCCRKFLLSALEVFRQVAKDTWNGTTILCTVHCGSWILYVMCNVHRILASKFTLTVHVSSFYLSLSLFITFSSCFFRAILHQCSLHLRFTNCWILL